MGGTLPIATGMGVCKCSQKPAVTRVTPPEGERNLTYLRKPCDSHSEHKRVVESQAVDEPPLASRDFRNATLQDLLDEFVKPMPDAAIRQLEHLVRDKQRLRAFDKETFVSNVRRLTRAQELVFRIEDDDSYARMVLRRGAIQFGRISRGGERGFRREFEIIHRPETDPTPSLTDGRKLSL